jgi:oligopeptide transport system ATP-binding protein
MESLPRLDQKGETLNTIKGLPPSLLNIPPGCPFHPRCTMAEDKCRSDVPPDHGLGFGRTSKCHFAEELVSRV